MTDLAPIKGLIELTDNFTSPIGLAEAALSHFTKENQESLKAVAGAAGIVAVALGAVAAATIELGKTGSDINDVNETLEHFAGGATAASAAMDVLRAGTKGTVDNFTLAKDAAHLLSAGVKLTTEDFNTLGEAAFVLHRRGLGGTKEQLELVSDALVTGRTRTLQMALGVIDAGDAEERYAKSLGITKDQLSDTGKVEAKRLEVMRILNAAVKDAGHQERNFGEEIEFAQTQLVNWVHDLSVGVANSKAFGDAFKIIESATKAAFGNDQTESIKTVVHWVEQASIVATYFAQGAIDVARIVNAAWSLVKTVILGVETAILGAFTAVLGGVEMLTTALASVPGAPAWIKDTAAAAHDASEHMLEMTVSVAKETLEAAKGVTNNNEFGRTLDSLEGTVLNVRDAMNAASNATDNNAKHLNVAAANASKLAAVQAQLNVKMIDQQKIAEQLVKSSKELSDSWESYYLLVIKNSGTSRDAQVADIEAAFTKQVNALDALDPLFNAKYKSYRAIADENLKGIEADWDSVKDKSIEGMQETADKALETWVRMQESGLHFSRDVMDEQIQKWRDLQDKARGWGDTAKKSIEDTTDKVKLLDHAWVTDADIAAATLNATKLMVKTLTGELISLEEAQKRQSTGGAFNVNVANLSRTASGLGINSDAATQLAQKGYSFQDIVEILRANPTINVSRLPEGPGPRIPGFKEGGTVDIMTGEKGPEVVRVPLGSTVYPTGTSPNGGGHGGTIIHNHYWKINGTAVEVAQKVKKVIMSELRSVRQFGSA